MNDSRWATDEDGDLLYPDEHEKYRWVTDENGDLLYLDEYDEYDEYEDPDARNLPIDSSSLHGFSPDDESFKDESYEDVSFEARYYEDESFEDRSYDNPSSEVGTFHYKPINACPEGGHSDVGLAYGNLSKKQEQMMLALLRLDMIMLPYFVDRGGFVFQGRWGRRKLQHFPCRDPIPFPIDDSAYESWLIGSAIAFIEQHNENIRRLADIVHQVRANNLDPRMDMRTQGAIPVKRYPKGDTSYLKQLVAHCEPRFPELQDYDDLNALTKVCVTGLSRYLVELGQDWLRLYTPWQKALVRDEVDQWSIRLSRRGLQNSVSLEEVAAQVEWTYGNQIKVEPTSSWEW